MTSLPLAPDVNDNKLISGHDIDCACMRQRCNLVGEADDTVEFPPLAVSFSPRRCYSFSICCFWVSVRFARYPRGDGLTAAKSSLFR